MEFALVTVSALPTVRTRGRWIRACRRCSEECVKCRAGSAERIVGRHESIVHERVHEESFFDHLPKVGVFDGQIAVVVVRDDYPVRFGGEAQNVPIVVTDEPFPAEQAARRVHEHAVTLESLERVAVRDRIGRTRRFLSPFRYERCDLFVPASAKPFYTDFDTATRKYLLITMAETKRKNNS